MTVTLYCIHYHITVPQSRKRFSTETCSVSTVDDVDNSSWYRHCGLIGANEEITSLPSVPARKFEMQYIQNYATVENLH